MAKKTSTFLASLADNYDNALSTLPIGIQTSITKIEVWVTEHGTSCY
ncbi:MAG: hypothetical protein IPH20_16480 [Bacteroidales bacterium]|nr:hypothetical protein [Bacteroidales bacterium]